MKKLWVSQVPTQGPVSLKDKFGLSWQIVPKILRELINDPDPVKSKRVMDAMLQMDKIDIAAMGRAYGQE